MTVEFIVACVTGAGAIVALWFQITRGLKETVQFRTEMNAWRENHEREHSRMAHERERTLDDLKGQFADVHKKLDSIIAKQDAHSQACSVQHTETLERLAALEAGRSK